MNWSFRGVLISRRLRISMTIGSGDVMLVGRACSLERMLLSLGRFRRLLHCLLGGSLHLFYTIDDDMMNDCILQGPFEIRNQ